MTHRTLLPRRYKALIGEIILIGGEIEQITLSALTRMAKMQIQDAIVLLSKVNISTNFKSLRYLVEAAGMIDKAEKMDEIDSQLARFLKVRNTFAHGVCADRVGEDIHFSVLSDHTADPADNTFASRVSIHDERSLKAYIKLGDKTYHDLRQLFQVRMLHEAPSVGFHEGKPPTPREIRKSNSSKPKPRPAKSRP